MSVWGVCDIGIVCQCAHELLDLARVSVLEGTEVASSVCPGSERTVGRISHVAEVVLADEKTYELESAELKFQIAAAGFEEFAAVAGPCDGWIEIAIMAEFVQDVVHLAEALLEFGRVEGPARKLIFQFFLELWVWCSGSGFGVRGVRFGFFDEG